MRYHTPIALGLIVVVVIGAAGPAIAHETQTVEGYELTFGGADEPVITGERMWLELEIVDNETGEPVENQSESLSIAVQKPGHEKVELDVSEKHGEPGVYQVPIIFTEPGEYVIHVEGSIEDTEIHTHFEKEVHDASELEYPDNETETADNESRSNADGYRSARTSSLLDFGIEATAIGVVALVGVVLRRRRL